MTTERNAQGVDGLAEVMGLLGKATPGEWSQDTGGAITRNDGTALFEHAEFNGIPVDEKFANTDAAIAAVNYLRSHGEAIRELVEAARDYSEHPHDAEGVNIAASRRLRAALAKFPEPRS